MSIPDDSEGKPLTFSELRALAEKLDLDGLASEVRGRTREEVPDVSEEDLLALDGKKADSDIIFGAEGETQLVFRPSKGRVNGAARWTVGLKGNTSRHDLQRELNKGTRGLWLWDKWDKEKGEPSVAFKAVEQLLHCYKEIRRQFRRELLLLLLRRLREETKQQATLSIEPKTTKDALYIYPKPLLETLHEERHALTLANEQLATVSEQLETVNEQRLRAQGATVLVFEVLFKDLQARDAKARADRKVHRPKGKLQIAFDLWWDEQWPEDVTNLQKHAWYLAGKLQRPPTKKELRERYAPGTDPADAQFSRLLKAAGLSWLPDAKSPRNLS